MRASPHPPCVQGRARFDPTGRYRYALWRTWDRSGPTVAFVMLNPSTAGAASDDPTIRRCLGFARAWGFGALVAVNLFALRSPEPARLRRARDPVGPDNDRHIRSAARTASLVIAAWGIHGALAGRDLAVRSLLAPHRISCLGLTRSGQPRHPLYLPSDLRPMRMRSKLCIPSASVSNCHAAIGGPVAGFSRPRRFS